MTDTPPAFTLQDLKGVSRSFPTGRPSLICFAKEDCATCNLVAPLLEAFHQAWGEHADVGMVAQARDGAEILRDRHGLTLPILDDGALRTSLAWDFESVPAVFWTGTEGTTAPVMEGFVKAEWQALSAQVSEALGTLAPQVDWAGLPDWRPGCGSKHLDPDIHDRLVAEAEGSPIRARRIEIAGSDDIDEFMFDRASAMACPWSRRRRSG